MRKPGKTVLPRLIHIHLPGVSWKSITNDRAAEILPGFLSLLETGTSRPLPPLGPEPVMDGIILTGRHPEKSRLLTDYDSRPDGFGAERIAIYHSKAPVLSQIIDSAGINCASINSRASNFLTLEHGLVVSDSFNEIRTKTNEAWAVPPGSVSPIDAVEDIVDFRIHPEDLLGEQLAFFIAGLNPGYSEENLKIIAKALAETSTTHAISTYLLDDAGHRFISATYSAMSIINSHFPSSDNTEPGDGVAWKFLQFLDMILARIEELTSKDDSIFITSSHRSNPFWIAKGPAYAQDRLFPPETTLYDIVPTAIAHFDLQHTHLPGINRSALSPKTQYSGKAQDNDGLPNAADLIALFEQEELVATKPSSEQSLASLRTKFRKRFNLGEVYRHEKQHKKALAEFENALSYIDGDPLTLLRICELALITGQMEVAESHFERCKTLDVPQFTKSLLEAYLLLGKNNLDAASKSAFRAQRHMAKSDHEVSALIGLHNRIAKVFKRAKHETAAKKHLEEAKKLDNSF